MRIKSISSTILALAVIVALCGLSNLAQEAQVNQTGHGHVKTDSRILYHDGLLMLGPSDVYFVWYGCWNVNCGFAGDADSQSILIDFMSNIGATPYFQINTTYSDADGRTPSGALFYGGSAFDAAYSRGVELTAADIQGVITDKIVARAIPQDPNGIYVLLASADVSSLDTGFCGAAARPHHGNGIAFGSDYRYAFIGNPARCPAAAAPQFVAGDGSLLPTPNGNLSADAMVSTLAHLLDAIVTNPTGGGWFDRYGLENADKCEGQFGTTYLAANGARANVRLGQRDYLIQQNWVNDKKGHCAMSSSQ